jgi:hypothetical protein
MNVGQLLRSILNDAQPGEPKTLELKVGQIVKGMVLQLLSEQDALINIGGVQLKAHLETPLKQGEVTMLQVQPESSNGQIVLKPIANSTIQIADESLADVLQSMGLKDTPANRQVIQTIHQENLPLTSENTQAFAKVMAQLPPNIQIDQWQQAAILAMKNNLPITKESINALHQVIFGPPIHQQLSQLSQQIDNASNLALSKQVRDSMSQVKQLLTDLLTNSANALNEPVVNGDETTRNALPTNSSGSFTNQADSKSIVNNTLNMSDQQATAPNVPLSKETVSNQGLTASTVSSLTGAEESEPARANANTAESDASTGASKAAKPSETDVKTPSNAVTNSNAGDSISIKDDNTQWIGKWLKSLGVEHEQQLFKALDKFPSQEKLLYKAGQALDLQLIAAAAVGTDSSNEAAKQTVTDSLKSALLQLHAFTDTPPAVKDNAQQLLQQITGQQLLLSPDRTSMFSHITMMIPMSNESGQQTAAVHIQSRKGSRGEIDATNCRLVFDLQMKSIGDTLVDVQVYNKIVSLHVHNDHDFVANLLDGSRDEIAASLHNVGYQFLSLKCTPFPEQTGAQTAAASGDAGRNSDTTRYVSKPYKGVDIRI